MMRGSSVRFVRRRKVACMAKLILRELVEPDEYAFFEGMKLWPETQLNRYTLEWKPGMSFADLLKRLRLNKLGQNMPPQYVAGTMFYGFIDEVIVGRLHIRHRLNEQLLRKGGHIGYAVAPPFRRKGYATEIMRQALPLCRQLRIERILVTCADDNTASWKIIEKFGGVLENKEVDGEDGGLIRRYWIDG
jgi:predicted acetyltransferase